MPNVAPPAKSSVEQALLARLWSRGLRAEAKGGRVVFTRPRGSDASITEDELDLADARRPSLLTMLRYDRAYGAELIREAHGAARRLGTRASRVAAEEALWAAHDALDGDERFAMHGLWHHLDRYLAEAVGG